MRQRLGISISADAVHAVLVSGGKARWKGERLVSGQGELHDALASLFGDMARSKFQTPSAIVVVGPRWSQVKIIHGLPATNDMRAVSAIVREQASFFFLSCGGSIATSSAARVAGGWGAAAFDGTAVSDIVRALRAHRIAAVTLVPAVSVAARSLASGTHVWRGDGQAFDVTISSGTIINIARREEFAVEELDTVVDGYQLAECAARGAYAGNAPYAFDVPRDDRQLARAAVVRRAGIGALAMLALLGAIAAPGLRAAIFNRRGVAREAALHTVQERSRRIGTELQSTSRTLNRIETLRGRQGRITVVLSRLVQALPESTALVTLRVDTLETALTALTLRASDLLSQVAEMRDLGTPVIAGAFTAEQVASARLERASLRFRRGAAPTLHPSRRPGSVP